MTYFKRTGKYNASTQSYNGRTYHSKKECAYAMRLDLLKKAKEIKDWKPQAKIDIRVNGVHICNHFVDFEVTLNNGVKEWHEVKGFATDVWLLKRKLVEALFEQKYVVIR